MAISNINELEYWKDDKTRQEYVWANLFLTNDVVRINLETAEVDKILSMPMLSEINMRREREMNSNMRWYDYGNNVLNGIAYD